MRQKTYKNFSLKVHNNRISHNVPSVCQFELTYGCGLHCSHCYTDCYNHADFIKKELKLKDIKKILDKIHNLGVVWLCLTGGDPLRRRDFTEIYKYAKEKGFFITIFTNGYSLSAEILRVFKESPPFSIEITLNAATKKCYEKISHVSESFERVKKNIRLIKKMRLPLSIKAQVTKENLSELPKISNFAKRLGVNFLPSVILYARLNGDIAPCDLRISPKEAVLLDGTIGKASGGCFGKAGKATEGARNLFLCAAYGGDGLFISPYGEMSLCPLIREPGYSVLEKDVSMVYNDLLSSMRKMKFTSDSLCRSCGYFSKHCLWCPGKAHVEKGDREKPIEYYCEVAKLEA